MECGFIILHEHKSLIRDHKLILIMRNIIETMFDRYDPAIKNDNTIFKEILKNFVPFEGYYSSDQRGVISTRIEAQGKS